MIKKCLFPVAGYGTRFLPATKSMPKEMLPVVNKPLVQYAVEEAVEAGLTEIAFVTGRSKRSIEDHFDKSYELEHQIAGSGKERYLTGIRKIMDSCTFSYTRQREMKGLGHAILTGRTLIGEEPFAVVLSDDLCINQEEAVLTQMVKLYKQFRCSIVAIEEVPPEETNKYGVIAGEEMKEGLYRVHDMVEKPKPEDAPSNLAIIGRYILTPDIFPALEKTKSDRTGEIQLTNGLRELLKSRPIYACEVKGVRHDTGNKLGFLKAVIYFAMQRPDLRDKLTEYLGTLGLTIGSAR